MGTKLREAVLSSTHVLLDHFIFFGEQHLRYVVREFMAHCLGERFHQGLGGQLLGKELGPPNDSGASDKVVCRSRLGGMPNDYQREAA
jgi:putative transposase